MKKKKKEIIVVASGAFDPIHIGHIEYLEGSRKLGDKLVVILNNDNWLKKKKEIILMEQEDRKRILEALACVDEVVMSSHEPDPKDMGPSADLVRIRPDLFANGGDRTKGNIPEAPVCEKYGISMVFGVGKKIRSSSDMLQEYSAAVTSSKPKSDYHKRAYKYKDEVGDRD